MALPWLKKVKPNQPGQPQQIGQPQMAPAPLNGGKVAFVPQAPKPDKPLMVDPKALRPNIAYAPDAAYAPKPSGAIGTNGPATVQVAEDLKQTVSPDQLAIATNAAIAELIGSGPRDTSADLANAKKMQDAATQKALLDARARAGFSGAGLSGALGAIEGDTRKLGAQALAQTKSDLESKARQEYTQNVALAAQTAAQAQQTEVEKQAWTIALQQLEKELQTDLNKDGVIAGNDKKEDPALDVSASSAGTVLTSTNRKRLKEQGLIFHAVPGEAYYLDQYGNQYPMAPNDPLHPDNQGWGG